MGIHCKQESIKKQRKSDDAEKKFHYMRFFNRRQFDLSLRKNLFLNINYAIITSLLRQKFQSIDTLLGENILKDRRFPTFSPHSLYLKNESWKVDIFFVKSRYFHQLSSNILSLLFLSIFCWENSDFFVVYFGRNFSFY